MLFLYCYLDGRDERGCALQNPARVKTLAGGCLDAVLVHAFPRCWRVGFHDLFVLSVGGESSHQGPDPGPGSGAWLLRVTSKSLLFYFALYKLYCDDTSPMPSAWTVGPASATTHGRVSRCRLSNQAASLRESPCREVCCGISNERRRGCIRFVHIRLVAQWLVLCSLRNRGEEGR